MTDCYWMGCNKQGGDGMSNAERQKRNAPVTELPQSVTEARYGVTPQSTNAGNTKPDVKGMSTDELLRRLHYIRAWQHSPEYREVLRRRAIA